MQVKLPLSQYSDEMIETGIKGQREKCLETGISPDLTDLRCQELMKFEQECFKRGLDCGMQAQIPEMPTSTLGKVVRRIRTNWGVFLIGGVLVYLYMNRKNR